MSELTTIARPYAKAAFDFAIEQSAVEKWTEMLGFAAAVAEDETVKAYLSSSLSAQKLANTVIFYLWRTIGSIWAKSYSVNG